MKNWFDRVRWLALAAIVAAAIFNYQGMFNYTAYLFNHPLEDMSHGWVVPFVSLFAMWQQRRELRAAAGLPNWKGAVCVVFFLAVAWFGGRGEQTRIAQVSFIGLVWAIPDVVVDQFRYDPPENGFRDDGHGVPERVRDGGGAVGHRITLTYSRGGVKCGRGRSVQRDQVVVRDDDPDGRLCTFYAERILEEVHFVCVFVADRGGWQHGAYHVDLCGGIVVGSGCGHRVLP